MVPLSSNRVSRAPSYLIRYSSRFVYGAVTRYGATSQRLPLRLEYSAGPISLAATQGISVDFFSCGYLDVSVLRVRSSCLCIQHEVTTEVAGFPHSEISGSKVVCYLPEAYRKLQRPSSPSVAKAFTMCAYSLDHITSNALDDDVTGLLLP